MDDTEIRLNELENKVARFDLQQLTYPLDDATQRILNDLIKAKIEDIVRVTFGGDGTDGQLNVSSGTTDIALGGARVVTKNYSSISITGTGAITFSSPHAEGTTVIFKSVGDVQGISTATRLIDLRSLGGSGGAGGAAGGQGTGAHSTPGKGLGVGGASAAIKYDTTDFAVGAAPGNGGAGGGCAASGTDGALGGATTVNTLAYGGKTIRALSIATLFAEPGGGGSGGTGGVDVGTCGAGGGGGRGAGGLVIECNGILNFTGTIDASGAAGTAGDSNINQNGAGGGGGAGGQVLIAYRTLLANTGTITLTAGAAGAAGSGVGGGTPGAAGAGGAGQSLVVEYT